MSSDSEFERFLQESLSASDTSDTSINKNGSADINDQLATSQSVLNDDKYWWNTQSSSDESDSSKEQVKDGSTWLKSDTELGGQTIVQSSASAIASHPLVSARSVPKEQPLVSPVATSGSRSSSGGEDFTHDSLDNGTGTSHPLPSELKKSTSPSLKGASLTSQPHTSITEQGSENEITLGNSQRQLEKAYEESSFESDSDDLNETLQPSESQPVSKSSSYSSLSSVDKQSTADSVHLETKAAPVDNQDVHSPALSKTSVASSSNRLADGVNLEIKTAENITVSEDENKDEIKETSTSSSTSKLTVSEDDNKNEDENKNEQATSTSSSMSKLRSPSKTSIAHNHLPSTDHDQTSAEQIVKDANSVVKNSYPDSSLEASKPSLMVSSLDKQMAELQEALRAAGLPLIDGSSNSSGVNVAPVSTRNEPIVRSPADLPEDIEQVLRELATQEVVSLSRKMLHEKQTEIENVQTVSQQFQTTKTDEIRTQPHKKLSKDIHIPLSDCNIVSSTENLLAEIKDFSTQSEDEDATDSKHTSALAKKKTVLKTNAKRENVFQRLSAPKSTPPMKKPPAVKRVPPKSTRRSRIGTAGSHKKEKQSSFDGQGTYDLKSTTELKLDQKSDTFELVKSTSTTNIVREQKLLQEIENVQNSWKEEKDLCKQLTYQLEEKEKEIALREEKTSLEHNKEKHQLKQEIFVLASKVKELECETNSRKRIASGGQLDNVISEEQRKQLELNIKEQETLLQGYQKENERVYEELTKARNELKTIQTRAFDENQQLAQQLANVKEELQKKDEQLIAAGKGGGALGIERISQLETQLASASTTCLQLHENVSELEKQNTSLQEELHRLSVVNKELEEKLSVSIPSANHTEVKEHLESEVKHLKRQLKWYTENQQLIDNDIEALQKKDKEIALLKEKLSKKVTDKKLAKDRAADAARIQQLEKQLKAMETSIRQKYPDSITSLIYASKSTEDATSSSDANYLNNRIQQLEKELEAKDKEIGLKIRSLHQKHTNMEVMYEEQVQALKEELQKNAISDGNNGSQPHHGLTNLSTEIAELKKTCSVLQQERDALLSAQYVNANSAEMTSLILKENTTLKNQIKQLELEMAHQKVKYNAQLTEAEASMKQFQKTHEREMADIQQRHLLAMKQLTEQHTPHQSEQDISQFKSQLATQQVTIARLKELLHKHKAQEQLLISTRQKEEKLSQDVNLLKEELLQATRGHTPEMHHFHLLLSKLNSLENRVVQYETRLQSLLISNCHNKSDNHISTLQQEWAKKLRGKDEEIESFRKDLDAIIETLQHLHDQSN